jgi:ABC-2 type transport system ATP-binding protein
MRRKVDQPAVSVSGLTKRYGEVEAVRGIDLEVARGETFGFLGPNGAGKSTTINILCTLVEPTGGTASVAGLDVGAAVRRRIGLVFQEPTLDGPMSGEQNLRFHGELYGVDRRTAAARREEVLRTVGLWERRKDPVVTYSGGMRRRLEIARGLLHSPQVLFLDEPTIGLDPQTRASIWNYLARLGESQDVTVFVTTHYMDEAENCDRIAIMNEGRIVALDTPEALKAQVGADRVVVATGEGTVDEDVLRLIRREFGLEAAVHEGAVTVSVPDGAGFVPRLFAALTAEGVVVKSVAVTRPSLDDVFLAHTGTTLRDAEASRGPSMHPMAMRMRGR